MEHGRSRQSMRNRSKRMCFLLAVFVSSVFLLPAGTAQAVDLKVGGYVKLDTMWTDKIVGKGGAIEIVPSPANVPLDSDRANDHSSFRMSAQESRVNFTATQDVEGVKLKGFIEGDFYGDFNNTNGQTLLRLRHAYAQADLPSGLFFVAGQTWSNFFDVEIYPQFVDFNYAAGQAFARPAQLRIGYRMHNDLILTASIEENKVFGASQELPILTGKAIWAPKFATVEAALAVGRNRAIFTDGSDDSSGALGVLVAAAAPFGPVTVLGHFQYIDGLGRYANGDFPDAVVVNNSVKNVKTFGVWGGLTYKLSPKTELNGYVGYAKAKDPVPATATNQDEKQMTVHVNVIQKLWGSQSVGLEYEYAKREQFDGQKGDMNRIHGAWWYYF